jgi:hypothetical protein
VDCVCEPLETATPVVLVLALLIFAPFVEVLEGWLWLRAPSAMVRCSGEAVRWDPCLYVADRRLGQSHVMGASALTVGLGSIPLSRCRLCWSLAYQRHAGTRSDFAVEVARECAGLNVHFARHQYPAPKIRHTASNTTISLLLAQSVSLGMSQ